ncbi:MAG: prolipoprotein diacylglyceryl transferase, partial [Deltaproteobacteria bacterium CG_4_8_14_3_um_filter_45_9]
MYPILFQFNSFNIYAYGFFIALGFVMAVVLAALKIRKSNIRISFEEIVELFFYTVFSAFLGSRILF